MIVNDCQIIASCPINRADHLSFEKPLELRAKRTTKNINNKKDDPLSSHDAFILLEIGDRLRWPDLSLSFSIGSHKSFDSSTVTAQLSRWENRPKLSSVGTEKMDGKIYRLMKILHFVPSFFFPLKISVFNDQLWRLVISISWRS